MLNTDLLDQKVKEARANGVPESTIQERNNEILNGVDAQAYQLPDPTAAPKMGDGTPAIGGAAPVKPYQNVDYGRLRMEQANDIKADDANGGKNLNQIKSYYDSFQPSQAEKDATGKTSAALTLRHDNILASLASLDASEKNLIKGGGANPLTGWDANLPVVGQFLNPEGKAYQATKIETATNLAKAITGSARPGQDVINKYMHSLADVTDAQPYAAAKLSNIRTQMMEQAKRFGFQDILDAYPDKNAGTTQAPQSDQNKGIAVGEATYNPAQHNPIENAGQEIKDTANGALGLPAAITKEVQDAVASKDPAKVTALVNKYQPNTMIGNAVIGLVQNLNKDLGQPLKGGDIVDRMGQNLHDRPLGTAMDAATVVAPARGLFAKTGEAATAGMPIDEALTTPKQPVPPNGSTGGTGTPPIATQPVPPAVTQPNPAQKFIRQGVDAVNGGGSNEYVARQAKSPWLPPQNQVLQDAGVYSHPTQTGRVQATSKATATIGANLNKAYAQSTTPIDGAAFEEKATNKLMENGVPKADASQIVSRIMSDVKDTAGVDISSLNSKILPQQFWKAAQFLEKYNPTIKGEPDATAYLKQNSQVVTRLMRDELGNAVPETKPLNGQYSALRDYADNGYEMKGGVSSVLPKWASKVAQPVINTANTAANLASNPKASVASYKPAVPAVTLANGEAPIANGSATTTPLQNTTPPVTSNQPMQGIPPTTINGKTIQMDKRTAQGNPMPVKGSQQLMAANSPSYLKKIKR